MRVTPAVCVWNRHVHERGFFAPNRSRMIFAHMRRAARNFATSSNRWLCATKKKLRRGAKLSTSSPASTAACTYSIAFENVKPNSCAAVAPASAMW